MHRRRFLRHAGTAAGALALTPADLLFTGTDALARISLDEAHAALGRLRDEPPCEAAVRVERGGPRLFLNGEETPPFWGLSTELLPTADNYTRMGLRLLQPQLGMASAWTGPGQYDFTALEAYLGRILAIAPDAYFFPRVQLLTPIWWKEAHPDETIVYGLDYPDGYYDLIRKRPLPLGEGNHYFTNFYGEAWEASYASQTWKRDTAAMLRAFVAFVEASPLVSRMMGYFFVHGRTEEWNIPGGDWMPDYSPPMQQAAGPLPTPRQRIHSGYGLLRDPAHEQPVIDFYRRLHEIRSQAVVHFAQAVKDAMDGRVLCGTFYGYVMEAPRTQESAHLAPEAVLDSPHLDALACPYTYQATNDPDLDRRESDMYDGGDTWLGRARGVAGDGAFRAMTESIRRRGKLYISEIDPSTYLDATNQWRGIGGTGSETKTGTLRVLRRDLGKAYAEGVGGWLYDFGPHHGVPTGWYGDAPIIDELRGQIDLLRRRAQLDIGSVAQIVVAADAFTPAVTRHWLDSRPWPGQGIRYSDFIQHWFLNAQARATNRIGAAVDLLHRTDLTAGDFGQYRLVLVPNAFYMTAGQVDALHDRLRGSGATVVWVYAPGLLQPGRIALDQMERLTGFRFEELHDPGPLLIDAELPGREAQRFGVRSPDYYNPRFAVVGTQSGADPGVLGRWTRPGKTALARTDMDGWTSVYAGTGPLPAEVLRWLADEAGAAPWTDRPAIVSATRGAAMLVATETGLHTLRLPTPMRAVEGGPLQAEHTLHLDFGEVRLFAAS